MENKFYIAINGQSQGPFSIDELEGKIQRNTLVWTKGMDNWTKAKNVSLLKDMFPETPPPPPIETNANAPKSPAYPAQNSIEDTYFGYELASRWSRLFAVLIESVILLIPIYLFFWDTALNSDDTYSLNSIIANTIFSAIIGAIFYPIFSGSIGHAIMGLKVISSVDGKDKKQVDAGILRESLKSIFSYAILPVIWLLWDSNKQNLYDKIVNTYVVKKQKGQKKSIAPIIIGIIIGIVGIIGLAVIISPYIEDTEETPEHENISNIAITPILDAKFNVTFRTEFQEAIYPSLVFGLNELVKKQGEDIDFFTISIYSNIKTNMRIVVQESILNFETVINEDNIIDNKKIIPSLKWKYENLKRLTQPGYVDMTFICYNRENDKEIGRKNLKLSYRAINECILAARLDNENLPLQFLVASYINEDSPIIDKVLQSAYRKYPDISFVGYQLGSQMVIKQVASIFYTLREKGIKYSNITTTSNTNPNVLSQYIRFSDEILDNTQANCADGTFFLCGILKKIGIHTRLVFIPGHVFLGYYTDDNKEYIQLLETTLVGSKYSFNDATNYQRTTYNSSLNKFNNGDYFDGYFVIDVDDARKIIKPIGR